ncbi:MAG: hypothetical protein ACTSYJ_06190 [Candidatus Thorarchaeota archaeon]
MEIFHTNSGIRFSEKVEQVVEFATKGNILTLLSSIVPFVEAVFGAISTGSFSKGIQSLEKKPPAEDIRMVENFESIADSLGDLNLREGFDALPTAKDRAWYFSLIIFALYTYLDVYSRDLVDIIENNGKLASKLEEHLGLLANKRDNKSRPPVLDVKGMRRFGIVRRLTTIAAGLQIDDVLLEIIGDELEVFRRGISKFVDIRGKVAHSNPKLDHAEYTFQELEKDLGEIEVDYSEIDSFIEKIGLTQFGLPQIKEATRELTEVLKKTQLLLLTAVIYPALIDSVLHALIDNN